jgi:hypothetical protein
MDIPLEAGTVSLVYPSDVAMGAALIGGWMGRSEPLPLTSLLEVATKTPSLMPELKKAVSALKAAITPKFNLVTARRLPGYRENVEKYAQMLRTVNEQEAELMAKIRAVRKSRTQILEERERVLVSLDPGRSVKIKSLEDAMAELGIDVVPVRVASTAQQMVPIPPPPVEEESLAQQLSSLMAQSA